MLEQFDNGLSRDTRKDRAYQRRGDKLAVSLEEEVACSDFFDIFAFVAVEPQRLFEAVVVSLDL